MSLIEGFGLILIGLGALVYLAKRFWEAIGHDGCSNACGCPSIKLKEKLKKRPYLDNEGNRE